MKKRLLLLLLLALPSPGNGQAILNVEALQGEEVEGTHGEVSARFRFASGNNTTRLPTSDAVRMKWSVRSRLWAIGWAQCI